MSTALQVLIIEDSEDDTRLILRELRRGGFEPVHQRVQTAGQLRDALMTGSWEIVLSDYSMPGFSGLAVLAILQEITPELPCIIVSGAIGEDSAVNAIREGARDYVMKDRLARLSIAVGQQLAESEARAARRRSEHDARRKSEEIAALHAIAAAVGRSLDPLVVLQAALSESLRVLYATGGAVILRVEGSGGSDPIVHEGFSGHVLEEIVRMVGEAAYQRAAGQVRIVRITRALPVSAAAGWGSYIVIPIVISDGEVGALVAAARSPHEFPADMISLAEGIGRHVGVAVENARLHERLQARTKYLETLQRINETLRSTLPLAQVLSIIAENAARTLDAIATIILIPDLKARRLRVGGIWGSVVLDAAVRITGLPVQGYSIPFDSGNLAAQAYLEGKMYERTGKLGHLLGGVDPPIHPAVVTLLSAAIGSHGMVALPLPAGVRTVGVIAIFTKRAGFSEAERSVLTGMADQAGLAVESARLFEETQRLRAFNEGIVEGVAEAILIRDEGDRITFANPAAEALLGYTREELLRRTWADLFDGRSGDPALVPGLPDGETRRYEAEITTKAGTRIPVIVSARPLREEGRETGTLSAITDISERTRSERLLVTLNRASMAMAQAMTHEETFAAVARELGVLGCACILLSVDAAGTGLALQYASVGGEVLSTPPAGPGTGTAEIVIPMQAVAAEWQGMVRGEAAVISEGPALLLRALPGMDHAQAAEIAARFCISAGIAAPLIIQGEARGVLVVTGAVLRPSDVSGIAVFANHVAAVWHKISLLVELRAKLEELQRVQGQLLQAQKMEAIGRLAGGVAHDFNNQLTAIIGTTELLREEFAGNDEVRGELEEILATAQRSASLTQQLLAFSRKQTSRPVLIDPDDLVANMQRMLSRLIGEDVKLILDLSAGQCSVLVDPGQLEQVVMNLVVNARDAMPRGGELRIATGRAEVDSSAASLRVDAVPGSYVQISVTDNGTGIDEETRSHLFEPFFTTKPEGVGTGLGLATAYGIIRQCGGFIDVTSAPGAGSCFAIHLPLHAGKADTPQTGRPETGAAGGNETVLLVEDDALVRDLVRRILVRGGFTVIEASDGAEGVKREESTERSIDLLLTDVVMPGPLSSVEMVDRIVTRRPGIRVLLTSGYPDQARARHGMRDPAHGLLVKPFTSGQLLRAVREALDRPPR
jgi:PAS domain S-box-containing protein